MDNEVLKILSENSPLFALLGVIVVQFFSWFNNYTINKGKDRRLTISNKTKVEGEVITYLKAQIETLQKEIVTLRNDLKRMSDSFMDLQVELLLLQNTKGIEFPLWLENNNGLIVGVNDAFEEDFLKHLNINKLDVIGKNKDLINKGLDYDIFQLIEKYVKKKKVFAVVNYDKPLSYFIDNKDLEELKVKYNVGTIEFSGERNLYLYIIIPRWHNKNYVGTTNIALKLE